MSDFDFDDDLFGSDDDLDFASEHPFDDQPLPLPEPEDSIEELRNRTSRGEGINDDLDGSDDFNYDNNDSSSSSSGGGNSTSFSLDQFNSGQRVILGVFVVIDALLIVFALLLIIGII